MAVAVLCSAITAGVAAASVSAQSVQNQATQFDGPDQIEPLPQSNGSEESDSGESDGSQEADGAGGADDATTQGAACNFTRVFDRVEHSVVTVRTFDDRGDRGQGSGWVWRANDSAALVVTNWHVVDGAGGADVLFADDEWRPVTELVGGDPYADLAVLSVENVGPDVRALSLAPSQPKQGDAVVALGSPLGLEGSVTRGIVSAVNRSVTVGGDENVWTVFDTVQIDAAISPGNSGGPLVDCEGRVVGVNFAGVDVTVGQNVNFAISADMVRQVVPALVETGSFDHSYLGIRGRTLSPTLARVNDLDGTTEGVLVTSVVAGTPAAQVLQGSPASERVTGLPVGGDVIVEVNGTEVADLDELQDFLFEHTRPGDTVRLTVLRDGRERTVSVTLDAKPLPRERPASGETST